MMLQPPVSPADLPERSWPVSLRSRVTWDTALLAVGAWFILAFVAVALLRLRYPFELEWMEGGVVDHVRRIMAGHRLYVQPSLRFVPFIYPPLYFYLGALGSAIIGAGFLPLRLLSFAASLGCFSLIFALVVDESGHRRSAFLAVAFFAACYPVSGGWYDLARVDALYVCLLLGGAYLLRVRPTVAAWVMAAVLLALAFFTKQSAAIVAAPLLAYAVWMAPRRGLLATAVFAGIAVGGTWLLDRAHGGWYVYYVFRLPARIQQADAAAAAFWSRDLVPSIAIAGALGLAALLPQRGSRPGRALFYLLLASALVTSAWLSRLHAAAHENVLIPAHAAVAVLLGLFLGRCWSESARGRGRLPAHVLVLLFVQFGVLLFDPRHMLPSAEDAALGRLLLQRIASVPGDVWLPQHGYLGALAAKQTYAHSMAMYDIIRAGSPADRERLIEEVRGNLAQRRFDLIIADRVDRWFREELNSAYQPVGPVFPSSSGFWPLTGLRLRPDVVYRPRPAPNCVTSR